MYIMHFKLNGTLLIKSPTGHENLAILMGDCINSAPSWHQGTGEGEGINNVGGGGHSGLIVSARGNPAMD